MTIHVPIIKQFYLPRKSLMSIELYRRYKKAQKVSKFDGQFMDYSWGNLPDQLNIIWLPYSQMLDEFSREIANSINELTLNVHRIKAWNSVISSLSDKQKMEAAHEFIDAIATVALNLPYVIRSRFIFATAHLCHQANRLLETEWKDDLPLDGEIYFKEADNYGSRWKAYKGLKSNLEKIGAKKYQNATHDFRNAYNHRFSPRIIIGQTNIVTRNVDAKSGRVSYSIGGMSPLSLEFIHELLSEQCQLIYNAFRAFQKLVREHESHICTDQKVLLDSV